jgi:signal peptidase II
MSKKGITLIVIVLIVLDQAVKIWVKTNMTISESITVFPNWFFICFIENPGAAFGIQLGGSYGKLALSLSRLILSGFLIWHIGCLIKKRAPMGVVIVFGLILAGAIGNIIDSAFYGLVFSESTYTSAAILFPEGGGYASFLHGKVVDMLYFPLFSGVYPSWLPQIGGNSFIFFSPIFNIADSYITIGCLSLLLFQRNLLNSAG